MKTPTETALLWDGSPMLPPVGALVLIAHGRDDKDHVCVVTGYEVQKSHGDRKFDHRVFVNVLYRGTDTKNQRLLCDIRPLTQARSIAQGDA